MPSNSNKGRVWLEAPVIVVSILLAFGIEADWAGFVEAREGRRLQESIRDDVAAMKSEITLRRTQGGELMAGARTLLAELASPSSEAQLTAALTRLEASS